MLNTSIKKKYYSVKEVCQYTSLPVTTLYTCASEGKIPSYKIGGRILFDLEVIEKCFAASQRTHDLNGETGEDSDRELATKITSAI